MFKKFEDKNIITTTSPIKEGVVLLRNFFSGGGPGSGNNIYSPILWSSASLSGGLYVNIFNRNYNSSPTKRLASLTYGYTTGSAMFSGSGFTGTNQNEKLKIYNLFAKKLLGNKDSIFKIENQEKHELIFVCMGRDIFKDNIVDEPTLAFTVTTSGAFDATTRTNKILNSMREIKDSSGGKYVELRRTDQSTSSGLCFLESGIFVIDPLTAIGTSSAGGNYWSGSLGYDELAKGVSGSIFDDLLFAARHRIESIFYYSESRMRTTFLKCTAEKDEFNYSSNPSYRDSKGRIRVVSGSSKKPFSYITTVGLLNQNNELVGVGKVQKPIKKNFGSRVSIVLRLDY